MSLLTNARTSVTVNHKRDGAAARGGQRTTQPAATERALAQACRTERSGMGSPSRRGPALSQQRAQTTCASMRGGIGGAWLSAPGKASAHAPTPPPETAASPCPPCRSTRSRTSALMSSGRMPVRRRRGESPHSAPRELARTEPQRIGERRAALHTHGELRAASGERRAASGERRAALHTTAAHHSQTSAPATR